VNREQRNRLIKHAALRDPFGMRDVLSELSVDELAGLEGDLELATALVDAERDMRQVLSNRAQWYLLRYGRSAT